MIAMVVILRLCKGVLHLVRAAVLMVARLHSLLIMFLLLCVLKVLEERLLFSLGLVVLVVGPAAGARSLGQEIAFAVLVR